MTLTSPEVWFAPVETGTYAGSGDRVTLLTQTPQIDAVALSMRWQVIGSALRFDLQAVAPKDRVPSQILDGIFGSHVWERSG